MRPSDHINAVISELRQAGAQDIVVIRRAKHPQVRWSGLRGLRLYTLPATPSDHRGHANGVADVRRMLRADGMLIETPRQPRQLTPVQRLQARVRELERELALARRVARIGAYRWRLRYGR